MTFKSFFCLTLVLCSSYSVYAMEDQGFPYSSDSEDDTAKKGVLVFSPSDAMHLGNRNLEKKRFHGPFSPQKGFVVLPEPVAPTSVGEAAMKDGNASGSEVNNRPLTPFATPTLRRTLSGMVREYQALNPQSTDAQELALKICQHPDFSRTAQAAGVCSFKDYMEQISRYDKLHEERSQEDEGGVAAALKAITLGKKKRPKKDEQSHFDDESDDDTQEHF